MAVLIDEQGSLASIPGKEPGRDFNDYHAVLASSGVPYSQFLVEDALGDASILDGCRLVVWFGLRVGGDSRRKALISDLMKRGVRLVLPDELHVVSGRDLHALAKTAGAYVPCEKYGLQVDMDGGFVSIHALLPGGYEFRLPFPAEVENLKNARRLRTSKGILPINAVAGETCWYGLSPASSPSGR